MNASYAIRSRSRRCAAVIVGIATSLRIGYALLGAFFPMESTRSTVDAMRAVVIRRFGGPDALEVLDVPVPEPRRGQVRVRVQAAAVNPVDIATRAGSLAEHRLMAPNGQTGIGWDLAGVIDAVGPEVRGYDVGDPVVGM